MAFFVLILAQSVIDSPRAEEVAGALQLVFGVERIVPKLEILAHGRNPVRNAHRPRQKTLF